MDALLRRLSPAHGAGQRRLSDVARHLTVKVRPDLAERLPFDDDEVFLDPLLFAYFTASGDPGVTLDQLLVGRMPRERRPEAVPVRADAGGVVDVPGIGALNTGWPNASLLLGDRLELCHGKDPISYTLQVEAPRPGSGLRVTSHIPALLSRLSESVPIAADAGPRRRADLAAALRLLGSVYPEYDLLVRESTRQVVLFSGDSINSFAAPAAHGCAFLNTSYGSGPVFVFEDLLHQCGHVAFTAMTLDSESLFLLPPDTLLSDEKDPSGEPRSAYVLLHAVFTERLMAEGLYRAIVRKAVTGKQLHEARGRLTYIMRRYHADISDLLGAGILAESGRELAAELAGDLDRLLAVAGSILRGVDTSGQPYNFSYETFQSRNPVGPVPAGV